MGGYMSTPDASAKERSDEIDRQIEEDGKRIKRECTVLVLGTWNISAHLLSACFSLVPHTVPILSSHRLWRV